jgi:hypothetical protein
LKRLLQHYLIFRQLTHEKFIKWIGFLEGME